MNSWKKIFALFSKIILLFLLLFSYTPNAGAWITDDNYYRAIREIQRETLEQDPMRLVYGLFIGGVLLSILLVSSVVKWDKFFAKKPPIVSTTTFSENLNDAEYVGSIFDYDTYSGERR